MSLSFIIIDLIPTQKDVDRFKIYNFGENSEQNDMNDDSDKKVCGPFVNRQLDGIRSLRTACHYRTGKGIQKVDRIALHDV